MTFKILPRFPDNSPEWLEQRRHGIGASDVAAILGESPWSTPYKVFLDKIGERWDPPQGEFLEWGHRLEPAIAGWVGDHHPEIGHVSDGIDVQSVEHPWQFAKPDRLITPTAFDLSRLPGDIHDTSSIHPLELKTSNEFMRGEWDTIPRHYLIQLLTQMIVLGSEVGYLAALIGGNSTAFFTIHRSDWASLEERILTETEAFWHRVETLNPPPPSDTKEAIHRWGGDDTVYVDDGEVFDLLGEYVLAKSDMKTLKEQTDHIRTEILKHIEDSSLIVDPTGEKIATYKPQSGHRTVDLKKLEHEHPDVYADVVSTGDPTRVLRIAKKVMEDAQN